MLYSNKFCRFIVLLLSLTLSAQAMAIASLGSCHRMTTVIAAAQVSEAVSHHHAESTAQHDGSMHHADSNGKDSKAPSTENTRVSCVACAACHMSSIILNAEIALIDIPAAGATRFADTKVARARNVASGLERPPRA